MFKLVQTAFWLLACASLCAQDFSISGSIREAATGKSLPGATIQLSGTSAGTISDESGKFLFSGLRAGSYTLEIKYIGYAPYSETFELSADRIFDIGLSESYQLTDEVIVYATRATAETPTTFTNVDQAAIKKQNFGQDLPFLLNWTPSLVTTSDAGAGVGYTGIRIRGSDATRVNVTINGIPYNDSESQGTFWVNISDIASSAQSIQIQRGVGTSTNGASAFGASVNLQTTSLSPSPYAEVSATAGSFNTQRYVVKGGTGLFKDHWSFDGRVSKTMSDGYIRRAYSDLGSYFFSGGYFGKNTIVKAVVFGGQEETYQAWYGVDAETMKTDRRFNWAGAIFNEDGSISYYDKEIDHYRQDHYQLHVSQRLSSAWTANVSLHYTYGRGYYEQYKQAQDFSEIGLEDIVLKDTTLTSGDFIVRRWLDNKFYGTTFALNYDTDDMTFTLGGGYNEYANARHFGEIIWSQYASNSSLRDNYYDGESEKKDFNIYSKVNYAITPAFNAFLDLQVRSVEYNTKGIDDDLKPYRANDDFLFFNPKAGVSYALAENSILYASYAIAHREPNRTDYMDGDDKPRPERLDNIEIGWRKATPKFNVDANYYFMYYTNQLVLTGAINNVGSPIRDNIGESYRTGIELSGSYKFSDAWSVDINATVSRNLNKDYVHFDDEGNTSETSSAIILSPNVIAGGQLSWTGLKNFQATLLSKYVGKQYLDNTENESLKLDSYFIHDLRFSYSIPVKGMTGIEASLLLNNILDKEYSSNGYAWGTTPYYYPQAGRNFLAMLTVKF
jgi:iron complex outermembrane recepter protein